MSDNFTQYGATYDLLQDDDDGIGLNTWVGIIAGVLSGLSIITIASVYFSQKCCAPKRQNTEALVLKKRLLMEQKNLANHKCKFPKIEHPSCTSIMQQEENDIAEEVKEIYSKIATDISKPIVCCPDKKTLYCYNPRVAPPSVSSDSECSKIKYSERKLMIDKVIQSINRNLGEHDNLDTLSVHEIASEALKKIANCHKRNSTPRQSDIGSSSECSPNRRAFVEGIEGPRRNNENEDNEEEQGQEKKAEQERTDHRHKDVKVSSRNLFTESEIQNASNMKSLFFEKWMKATGESDGEGVGNGSDESIHKDISISYDDVDSVLTSISRMDASRVKRLKNTRFYKKMISGMQPIRSESMPTAEQDSDEEHSLLIDEEEDEMEKLLGKVSKRHSIEPIGENELYMTQEEINYMAMNKDARLDETAENQHETTPVPSIRAKQASQHKLASKKEDAGDQAALQSSKFMNKLKPLTVISDDEDHHQLQHLHQEPEEPSNLLDARSDTTLFKVARVNRLTQKVHIQEKEVIVTDKENGAEDDVDEIAGDPTASFWSDDGISITPSTTEERDFEDVHGGRTGKVNYISVNESTSRPLTDWSQTAGSLSERVSNPHMTGVYGSEYTTSKSTKDDSCYSSGITKGCCTSSSCSCSNKTTTTTWGEIAFKEREKYKNSIRLFGGESDHASSTNAGNNEGGGDMYYVISNNNCFVIPGDVVESEEVNGCSESEFTRTSYFLSEGRQSEIPGGRHTT